MKENKALKAISYILLPMLVGIIIISVLYSFTKDSYSTNLETYTETSDFGGRYMKFLSNISRRLIYKEADYAYVEDNGIKIHYIDLDEYNYNIKLKNNYILIIYKNKAITNVNLTEGTTISSIKQYIEKQAGEKLVIVNGNIKSNPLKGDILNYKHSFENSYYYTVNDKSSDTYDEEIIEKEIIDYASNVEGKSIVYESSRYEDFEIYSTYQKEFVLNDYDTFVVGLIKEVSKYEDIIYFAVPICSIFVIIIMTYLVTSIGHIEGKEGISINDFDKIPLEILLIALLIIGYICIAVISVLQTAFAKEYYKLTICGIITAYFAMYTVLAILVTTIIKRIKARVFWDNTILGKIGSLIEKDIKKVLSVRVKKKWQLALLVIVYVLLMIVILCAAIWPLGIIIDFVITLILPYRIIKRINSFDIVEEHLKKMSEGNTSEKISKDLLSTEFKTIAEYINNISNGLENAVQERIKSERLKTELITNVSHDIKTPLTSIINYVDLLKRENIENEKANEYIEILEAKSHRLKRLTEDLVEASKVSSGNVKLNLEKINIEELINQTTGEFEDKFKEKGLEVITKIPEEEILIEADSRYMYRIIENLFSNISKYAAQSSRVYIDILSNKQKVNISIKNISEERLNITEEELMQRFVRGDKSRTTEGSGLGLSISKSLTELQKGKFGIQIDGDLFKVELEFERI